MMVSAKRSGWKRCGENFHETLDSSLTPYIAFREEHIVYEHFKLALSPSGAGANKYPHKSSTSSFYSAQTH
jgi:hypothetical protein